MKKNNRYSFEYVLNKILLPLFWTLVPLAVFALIVLVLYLQ